MIRICRALYIFHQSCYTIFRLYQCHAHRQRSRAQAPAGLVKNSLNTSPIALPMGPRPGPGSRGMSPRGMRWSSATWGVCLEPVWYKVRSPCGSALRGIPAVPEFTPAAVGLHQARLGAGEPAELGSMWGLGNHDVDGREHE